MAQLVGSACVLCDQRISSSLEGEYCADCGNAVHLKCLKRSTVRSTDGCSSCGADPTVATTLRLQEQQRLQTAERVRMEAVANEGRQSRRRLGMLFLSGFSVLVLIPLGYRNLVNPELWADPHHFSVQEVAFGLGPIVVGILLCFYTLRMFRKP